MPTDAKCGLLVGVGLVLAVAVLFFQKEPMPGAQPGPPAVQTKSPAPRSAVKPTDSSPVRGRPVSRVADPTD